MFVMKAMFFAIVFAMIGCDGHTSISGVVVDENGKPLGGVQVTLKTVNLDSKIENELIDEEMTEDNGEFQVAITHQPTNKLKFSLIAEKENYNSYSEVIKANYGDDNHRITLEKK
ncbi:carboxypeptidase-like regulatory domain-containing protein [uncultured Rubinisphaera sp.]|uniref:carboxypeptidase-like regulatory domain-containing protein n=1 Tax=uncultured Rubinisphaera sp. TaxID=1678686 RepID=UPI0030DD51F1|tara:strand:- start:450 stop:794 length:345 start_codon:yes stop_codon:yes gene_type:complete